METAMQDLQAGDDGRWAEPFSERWRRQGTSFVCRGCGTVVRFGFGLNLAARLCEACFYVSEVNYMCGRDGAAPEWESENEWDDLVKLMEVNESNDGRL